MTFFTQFSRMVSITDCSNTHRKKIKAKINEGVFFFLEIPDSYYIWVLTFWLFYTKSAFQGPEILIQPIFLKITGSCMNICVKRYFWWIALKWLTSCEMITIRHLAHLWNCDEVSCFASFKNLFQNPKEAFRLLVRIYLTQIKIPKVTMT